MSGKEEQEEEELDPRVQVELDRLNTCSEDINRLENKLEEANAVFRSTLSDSTANLKLLASRLGGCVEKARPYFEAREAARRTQVECQKAAVQFQRASVLHQNARETIQLAEARFLPRGEPVQFEFDSAWQEMLNHATMRLLEAEQLKNSSEREHLKRANNFADAQKNLKSLERKLERHIDRSRSYFDQREVIQQELLRQKLAIQQLQRSVAAAKAKYSASLRELENISEQIHQQRRIREREPELVAVDLEAADLISMSAVTESTTSDYQEDFKLSQEQQYWTEMREQIEALSASLPALPAPDSRSDSTATPSDSPPADQLNVAALIARHCPAVPAEVTGLYGVTGTQSRPGSPEAIGSDGVTGTQFEPESPEVTGLDGVTCTLARPGSPEAIESDGVTGTQSRLGSPEVTGSDGVTCTQARPGSPEVTGSGGVTGPLAGPRSPEITGSDEFIGPQPVVPEISGPVEVTGTQPTVPEVTESDEVAGARCRSLSHEVTDEQSRSGSSEVS